MFPIVVTLVSQIAENVLFTHKGINKVIIKTPAQIIDNFKFDIRRYNLMADAMFMYAVATGMFVFLAAILFGARAKRYSGGWTPDGMTRSEHGASAED